jgi:hypothetical protein
MFSGKPEEERPLGYLGADLGITLKSVLKKKFLKMCS